MLIKIFERLEHLANLGSGDAEKDLIASLIRPRPHVTGLPSRSLEQMEAISDENIEAGQQ